MKINLKSKQLTFYIIISLLVIGAIIIYTLFLRSVLDNFAHKSALSEAQRTSEQLLITRGVIADLAPHGNSTTNHLSQFSFTPTAVGIAISNTMKNDYNYYVKQTSLAYRNPTNAPDEFETKMLNHMEDSKEIEYSKVVSYKGEEYLRYGRALYIEQSCMRCHGEPYKDVPKDIYDTLVQSYGDVSFNYKVGDLKGAISIAIPTKKFHSEYSKIFMITMWTSIALLVILFTLFYLNNLFIINPHIKLLDKTNKELEDIAFLDLLTNIPNRRAFNFNIKRDIEENKNFWLLIFDIDGFKFINDNFGHEAGDIVLKVFSKKIMEIDENIKLYRVGGDGFTAMVFNKNEQQDIKNITNEIFRQINLPINIGKENVKIGVSIGAVHYKNDADDLDTLIKYGDIAMYNAKEQGKNQVVFYKKELLDKVLFIKELEDELKVALEEKQFFLLYQPQYDYKENKIIGTEALLRWNHPTKGVVNPDYFIKVAEDSGLIKDIGEWILFEAVKQNKAWQDLGLPHIVMSVNVTSAQLNDFGFLMNLIDVINETKIEPEYLEIEFIERDAISNEGFVVDFMEQLKRFRISSAIDDFGTGYSSLSYITKYPIKKIKIDRLFITDIHKNEAHQTIVKSIISIASHLNMKILAEGVETKEELDFLISQNCTTIQGYYYSKPLKSKEMKELLAKQKIDK